MLNGFGAQSITQMLHLSMQLLAISVDLEELTKVFLQHRQVEVGADVHCTVWYMNSICRTDELVSVQVKIIKSCI